MDQFIGSIFYIAPEVWFGEYDTSACDVWSFGIILYALITKEFPFDSKK
jgi:serine/threonine protein kinase